MRACSRVALIQSTRFHSCSVEYVLKDPSTLQDTLVSGDETCFVGGKGTWTRPYERNWPSVNEGLVHREELYLNLVWVGSSADEL